MMLSVSDLVNTLRTEVSISNSAAGLEDSGLIDMSDEQITTLITLGATRLSTDCDTLEEVIDEGYEYPLLLLAKMELITTLATLKADLVDMNADNNNRLSLGQRFEHYSKLLGMLQDAYDKWADENDASTGGTGGVVTTYDVILTNRFMTLRNYQLQASPKVRLRVHPTLEGAEVSWTVKGFDHFGMCRLYLGTSPVIDAYLDGANHTSKIADGAKLLKSTTDIRDNMARISGLVQGNTYYIAVVSVERNGVFGYAQKSFQVLEPEPEEEEETDDSEG